MLTEFFFIIINCGTSQSIAVFFFQVLHLRHKYYRGNVRRVAPAKTQLLRDIGLIHIIYGAKYIYRT